MQRGLRPGPVLGGKSGGGVTGVKTKRPTRPFNSAGSRHDIARQFSRYCISSTRISDVSRPSARRRVGRPLGGGVFGHVEVCDAPPMVSEHDENEEDAQACRGNREEIEGEEISDMIGEERSPRLGWRCAPLRRTAGKQYAPRGGCRA